MREAVAREILGTPSGPDVAAFFDFDGTLIDGYSAVAFLKDRARRRELPAGEFARLLRAGLDMRSGKADFERFMRVGTQAFRGHDARTLGSIGDRLLRSTLGGLLFPEMLEIVDAHRRRGHTLVIASSALPFQVEPVARELGVDHVLCTRLETIDDLYTGRVEGAALWGPGKAAAVRAFAESHGIALDRSYAYGNGYEDVEFLSAVAHPRVVNPDAQLQATARREGWPVSRFGGRGRPGLDAVVRTAAAYGGMATAFGAGLGLGLLKRSRREAVNFTTSVGSDVTLALAGVRLNVTGAEHIEAVKPAVFIFNHQSILDGFIVMKLVRTDMTGVAKKEVASQPGFGHFARLAGIAFVDRGDTRQAVGALAPVVEKLRDGYSIAISPEGTRSPTPALGRFKKGAFHMAMQGGVPIVPIVIRNAGEVLWRGSKVMRPGVVDVHVHEPISVADWTRESLDERIAEVHALFLQTLSDWPRRGAAARDRPDALRPG
ncbi:MAG: putative phosphoserine phosphatase / 1-acylglycerol-3-phosphate O-acyltransferase [Solirubrobacteraceae bacterium]|nr:putative phosphoserine phosphatase / 1-acylglycerol-3-phosphate O-acyltransferase [Solirubrobacteraceae bacterium]